MSGLMKIRTPHHLITLPAAEQNRLVLAWHTTQDSKARDRLVAAFAPFVAHYVAKAAAECDLPADDLHQEAYIAFLDCLDKCPANTDVGKNFADNVDVFLRANLGWAALLEDARSSINGRTTIIPLRRAA